MPHDLAGNPNRGSAGLVDVLDRILDKGLVVAGDIKVSLAEVELLTIRIRLMVCSIDKAEQIGLDWWKYDRNLSPGREEVVRENQALREQLQLLAQLQVLLHHLLAARRQMPVVLPPVEPDLLRLVDGADHEADADRQQLDFGKRHLDIAGDDQALVEDAVENVDKPGISAVWATWVIGRHAEEVSVARLGVRPAAAGPARERPRSSRTAEV